MAVSCWTASAKWSDSKMSNAFRNGQMKLWNSQMRPTTRFQSQSICLKGLAIVTCVKRLWMLRPMLHCTHSWSQFEWGSNEGSHFGKWYQLSIIISRLQLQVKQSGWCWWAKSIIKGCNKYPESCIIPIFRPYQLVQDFVHQPKCINYHCRLLSESPVSCLVHLSVGAMQWSSPQVHVVHLWGYAVMPIEKSMVYDVRYVYTECNNPKTHMLDVR